MQADGRGIGLFEQWRQKYISERRFMLILALVIGVLTSFAACLLHTLIHIIQHLLTSQFDITSFNWLYLIFPTIGIYLTSLFVRHIVKDNISHGITRILSAISTKESRLKGHNTWSSVIASAITIGFGGSVGAEAPIVLTGSAIGSTLGQRFNLNAKQLMILVGCGAAGAIGGIFKAPMAGLVFTIEVLMIDLTMASLLPLMISSVTATCVTYILLGNDSLFTFSIENAWNVNRIPANILLGVSCGFASLYFVRSMTFFEDIYGKLKEHPYLKLLLGGTVLSILIFLFPSLYGEGYNDINVLLNGASGNDWQSIMQRSLFYGNHQLIALYVALVIFTKTIATASTNGGGGCGGTFAPSLFVGCFTGFLFAYMWNEYSIGIELPVKNFALLGMAGVMSGVMHAPLTGIFLIAELTGGYDLFMPLIIVSVASFLTMNIFEPHSIYAMRLAKQGKLLTHHTDRSVLTLMNLDACIERDYVPLKKDMLLADVIRHISSSRGFFLPVLNEDDSLIAVIDISKIRNIIFRTELYHHFTVEQLMVEPPATVGENDAMEDVMRCFDETGANQLPVVGEGRVLRGFIARARLYSQYRKMVADMSRD